MRRIKEKFYAENCFFAGCGIILLLLFYSLGVNAVDEMDKYMTPCYGLALITFGICQKIFRKNGAFSYSYDAESAFAPVALIASVNFLVKVFLSLKAVVKFSLLFFSMPIITTITCILIFLTAKLLYSKNIALLVASLYSLMPVSYVEKLGDLKQPLAALVTMLVFYLILVDKESNAICVLSGFMLFAAFVIDTNVFWIIPGVIFFLRTRKKDKFFKKYSCIFVFVILYLLYVALLSLDNGQLTGVMNFSLNLSKDRSFWTNIKNLLSGFASNIKIFGYHDRRNLFVSCYYCTYYLFLTVSALLGTYISMKIVKKENVIFTTFMICVVISCVFGYDVVADKYLFAVVAVFLGGYSFEPALEFVPMSIEKQNDNSHKPTKRHYVKLNKAIFTKFYGKRKPLKGREGKVIFTIKECSDDLSDKIKKEINDYNKKREV